MGDCSVQISTWDPWDGFYSVWPTNPPEKYVKSFIHKEVRFTLIFAAELRKLHTHKKANIHYEPKKPVPTSYAKAVRLGFGPSPMPLTTTPDKEQSRSPISTVSPRVKPLCPTELRMTIMTAHRHKDQLANQDQIKANDPTHQDPLHQERGPSSPHPQK